MDGPQRSVFEIALLVLFISHLPCPRYQYKTMANFNVLLIPLSRIYLPRFVKRQALELHSLVVFVANVLPTMFRPMSFCRSSHLKPLGMITSMWLFRGLKSSYHAPLMTCNPIVTTVHLPATGQLTLMLHADLFGSNIQENSILKRLIT